MSAPRDDSMPVRVTVREDTPETPAGAVRRCANEKCKRPLINKRSDARHCSGGCRAEAFRLREAQKISEDLGGPDAEPDDGKRTEAHLCGVSLLYHSRRDDGSGRSSSVTVLVLGNWCNACAAQ
jgi:hypothetical protein